MNMMLRNGFLETESQAQKQDEPPPSPRAQDPLWAVCTVAQTLWRTSWCLGLTIKTSSSWNRKMPNPKVSCRHEWGGAIHHEAGGCGNPEAIGRTLGRSAQEPAG